MHPGPVLHNWHLHLKTTQPQQQPAAAGRLGGENRLYLQSSEERTELYWAGGGRGAVLRSSSAVAVTSGCAAAAHNIITNSGAPENIATNATYLQTQNTDYVIITSSVSFFGRCLFLSLLQTNKQIQ